MLCNKLFVNFPYYFGTDIDDYLLKRQKWQRKFDCWCYGGKINDDPSDDTENEPDICREDKVAITARQVRLDYNMFELKEAELMTNRLSLLSAIDPYTGRYFSQEWIQQNVLRLTDDEIAEMNSQIDKEKEQGLGLPISVTNDIASQQMGAAIQTDASAQQQQNQMDMDQANAEHQHGLDMKAAKAAPKKEEVFTKLKRIL